MENRLIIFIKYPEPGRVKTRLGCKIGYERAALVYEQLVKQQILDLAHSGPAGYDLACYVDDSRPIDQYRSKFGGNLNCFVQKGRGLGERMARAFEESFEQQYKRVVLMGSDIPLVNSSDITIFLNHLLTHQMVIGPARDGGYYMIGFQRGVPVRPLFENMAWSTPDVFKTTLARASGLTVRLEKTWFDIDTLEDLKQYQDLLKKGKGFARTDLANP
jgi:rSAM/selenodomain-associated transferase 1